MKLHKLKFVLPNLFTVTSIFCGFYALTLCAGEASPSQLYQAGMSLFAIQELLGHSWTGTTARYIHVHGTHVEDAWVAGQQQAPGRWKGMG